MNTKRYTWSETAYKNVAKKVLEFRQELDQVSVEEICKILGVPSYTFTRLGNEKYWFIDIHPKHWETLQNAVNNLHIEGDVIKDYRKTPVKVIPIDDLKTKKSRGRKKSKDNPSPADIVSPKDESEINPKDQETSMDEADIDLVKKETLEFTPEGEKSSESFLKPRIGNFEWIDKEKGSVKFVEDPLGNFKIVDNGGVIFPIGPPVFGSDRYRSAFDTKETSDLYKRKGINVPGTLGTTKVELSAKTLMEIDDQVRRIIKEEIPIIIEDCLCNIKFDIELPIRIKV